MTKKISWITPECYLDVDLPIIAKLKDRYDIYWQIVLPYNSTIDNEEYVHSFIPKNEKNVLVEFVYHKHRMRDIRTLAQYMNVVRRAKKYSPNFYYISNYQMPYGIVIYKILLPLNKVIVPCHNVSTPKGASNPGFTEKYTNWWLNTFNNIQVFSKSQKAVLDKMFSNKNVLLAPLALKNYGAPTKMTDKEGTDIIRFLQFGIINDYKRVDLLLEAGNILFERGYKNIRIRVAGNSKTWESEYAPLVRHNEIFEFDIRRIPNEEIPNLFADSHYFVMPYQDIAQSGAITVAFCYNLPTIVSDIEPFKEFVTNGVTGLTFKSEDATALADKMQYVIDNHDGIYDSLKIEQRKFIERELSLNAIVNKYIEYFDKI